MKEYICLDELDETRQDFMDSVYNRLSDEPDNFKANYIIDAYDLSIDNLPIVTEADIRLGAIELFVNELKLMPNFSNEYMTLIPQEFISNEHLFRAWVDKIADKLKE